jgi:EAL domain-containing protein (putative c-di-GMP-specific phosphodiesterase class I)
MVDKVLADLNEFRAQDIDIGHIAINTTSFDFTSGEFGGRLLGKLRAHDLPPSMIEIEICETVLLGRGRELVGRVVSELTEAGVGISLDDFGTGYASLVSTKQLPISGPSSAGVSSRKGSRLFSRSISCAGWGSRTGRGSSSVQP